MADVVIAVEVRWLDMIYINLFFFFLKKGGGGGRQDLKEIKGWLAETDENVIVDSSKLSS